MSALLSVWATEKERDSLSVVEALLSCLYELKFTLIWLRCSDACWHPRWHPLPLCLPLTDTWAAAIKKSISRVIYLGLYNCITLSSFCKLSYLLCHLNKMIPDLRENCLSAWAKIHRKGKSYGNISKLKPVKNDGVNELHGMTRLWGKCEPCQWQWRRKGTMMK